MPLHTIPSTRYVGLKFPKMPIMTHCLLRVSMETLKTSSMPR